jgi:hypothetical protein
MNNNSILEDERRIFQVKRQQPSAAASGKLMCLWEQTGANIQT